MSLKVYNTMSGKKEEFVPVREGKIGMYVCGITAYDYSHLGHARAAVVFDVIYRYFQYLGFDVMFVRNFTDVDDKIIDRANKEKIGFKDISEKYIGEYRRDMDALGVKRPSAEPKASEHIDGMIDIIEDIIEKGYGYVRDGDVYFSVEKKKDYGKLSGRNLEEMQAGARIEIDERKENSLDFALWKASKPGEPTWESPWGLGRPGWHIECSVMSKKYLGDTFDIHGGGEDLVFPHHENEIAQSEAATGKPFAKYWIHNGFVNINKEKMSKSLGNFFTIREILEKFHPEVVRFFLLSNHYRSPIDFTDKNMSDARSALDRFYTLIRKIDDLEENGQENQSVRQKVKELSEKLKTGFKAAMDDDFNTAKALGEVFEAVRLSNQILDSMKKETEKISRNDFSPLSEAFQDISTVLGIFHLKPEEWFQDVYIQEPIRLTDSVEAEVIKAQEGEIPLDSIEIENMIEERNTARREKNWKRADELRDKLHQMGIILEDTDKGTQWKVKR